MYCTDQELSTCGTIHGSEAFTALSFHALSIEPPEDGFRTLIILGVEKEAETDGSYGISVCPDF